MGTGHGLIEGCLNTLEDQSGLGDILWGSHTDGQDSDYVNIGGHVLCRNYDESGDVLSKTFTSTTYIPEGSEHLRFFFGGSIYDGGTKTVGGQGWKAVFFDDLVITKEANAYGDAALAGKDIKLKSTITPLNGEVTGTLVTAVYEPTTNKLLDVITSDEMTITEATDVSTTIPYPDTNSYTIKTFFFDGLENLAPYTMSYEPNASLAPNYGFETPFTGDYRWRIGTNTIGLIADAAYTGTKGASAGISNSGTWIKVGQGAIETANNTVASPTALANVLLNNGKGKYKISFMAKTVEGNATVKLEVRRHIQPTKTQDVAMGKAEVTPHQYSSAVTATTEWQKFEFEMDLYPKTPWGGAAAISYRKNNYPLYIIATSTAATDKLYIDDFKIEKVSE